MASSGRVTMKVVLVCCCWAIVMQPVLADGTAQFLDEINQFRISLSLPKLLPNPGAACVAQQVAVQYQGTPCSPSTSGTTSVSGEEPQLGEALLSKCHLQLVNVKDGFMGPTCVPAGTSAANAPKIAAHNVTVSPAYTEYVNDTRFVSAGAGETADHSWFVLVLATNISDGNYQNQDLDPSDNQASSFNTGLRLVLSVAASSVSALLLLV